MNRVFLVSVLLLICSAIVQAQEGYLLWVDGKARILVDCGPGTAVNFGGVIHGSH